jgi:hypothetical protein
VGSTASVLVLDLALEEAGAGLFIQKLDTGGDLTGAATGEATGEGPAAKGGEATGDALVSPGYRRMKRETRNERTI